MCTIEFRGGGVSQALDDMRSGIFGCANFNASYCNNSDLSAGFFPADQQALSRDWPRGLDWNQELRAGFGRLLYVDGLELLSNTR
jgi:hypothetical protein